VVTPLHAADVVAVPSMWNEPFGRVVVEALAAGLPVVASRVGGIPEILSGDLSPLLYERGSASELADRLHSLMGWRRDRPELRDLALARAADFTIERMIDEIERLLPESDS
jgi:glycosyltransferase involved in cell wall biosynthesis